MVGEAGGRPSQAPINWPSAQVPRDEGMCSLPGGSSCIWKSLEYGAKGTETSPTEGWLLVGA